MHFLWSLVPNSGVRVEVQKNLFLAKSESLFSLESDLENVLNFDEANGCLKTIVQSATCYSI